MASYSEALNPAGTYDLKVICPGLIYDSHQSIGFEETVRDDQCSFSKTDHRSKGDSGWFTYILLRASTELVTTVVVSVHSSDLRNRP